MRTAIQHGQDGTTAIARVPDCPPGVCLGEFAGVHRGKQDDPVGGKEKRFGIVAGLPFQREPVFQFRGEVRVGSGIRQPSFQIPAYLATSCQTGHVRQTFLPPALNFPGL